MNFTNQYKPCVQLMPTASLLVQVSVTILHRHSPILNSSPVQSTDVKWMGLLSTSTPKLGGEFGSNTTALFERKENDINIFMVKEYLEYPSCLHVTKALLYFQPVLHTLPHSLLYKTSNRPLSVAPLTSLDFMYCGIVILSKSK